MTFGTSFLKLPDPLPLGHCTVLVILPGLTTPPGDFLWGSAGAGSALCPSFLQQHPSLLGWKAPSLLARLFLNVGVPTSPPSLQTHGSFALSPSCPPTVLTQTDGQNPHSRKVIEISVALQAEKAIVTHQQTALHQTTLNTQPTAHSLELASNSEPFLRRTGQGLCLA